MSTPRQKEERGREVAVVVGRPRTVDVPEEEKRMKQRIETFPDDADALCEYACFLASVRRDFKGASEHYERAIRADCTRARRVSVQLWADMFCLQVERETAFVIKERWLDLFASLPSYSEGFVPKGDAVSAALRLGVADDKRLAKLVDKTCDEGGLVDVFQLSEGLRIEPHVTRYRAIALAEKILGPAPLGETEGELPREASVRRALWSLLLGRGKGGRKVTAWLLRWGDQE
mmetsp:Transcript_27983/g.67275  ORF Transcript_27983/g.67275 Transcript_27983/m.67275 type:complete len:232 (+) Transcript_27983:2-697(+)